MKLFYDVHAVPLVDGEGFAVCHNKSFPAGLRDEVHIQKNPPVAEQKSVFLLQNGVKGGESDPVAELMPVLQHDKSVFVMGNQILDFRKGQPDFLLSGVKL